MSTEAKQTVIQGIGWDGDESQVVFDPRAIKSVLLDLKNPVYAILQGGKVGFTSQGSLVDENKAKNALKTYLAPLPATDLGDPGFSTCYASKYNYFAGSMANGISSEQMVIALGSQGYMASFGAAGLVTSRVEQAIHTIQKALPNGPYAFNLIHSPNEEALEKGAVDLFLKHGVYCVEASAYLDLTPHVVRYRVAGLQKDSNGRILAKNKIIAKVSRREVAQKFMQPPPEKILEKLIAQGSITQEQAEMAKKLPIADDITVEADSGGHTDNRPLVVLLPSILELRDAVQKEFGYEKPIRVGAGGGIGSPKAALAAFAMGAAYIVTGTVNQACIEAGTSEQVKKSLAMAGFADVMMAPASDMFEMGIKLQVLKRGSLFPMRAQKLYDLYQQYGSIEEIPAQERQKLEKQIFQKSLDQVWQETKTFFEARDPEQIQKAEKSPKKKMALVFRWYLGLSSHWANSNEKGREMDYQIWCGPAIGSFNDWCRGTQLEKPENRKVSEVAGHLMRGTAYLTRIHQLRTLGIDLSDPIYDYTPNE